MPAQVDPVMLEYIAANLGGCHVEIRGATDPVSARRAVEYARVGIQAIRHMDEPNEPLASFVSEVWDGPSGPSLWFDIADADGDPAMVEHVLRVLVTAGERLDDGVLAPGTGPPRVAMGPAFVPFELPVGFPVPDGEVDSHTGTNTRGTIIYWADATDDEMVAFFMSRLPAAGFEIGTIERTETVLRNGIVKYSNIVIPVIGNGREGVVVVSVPSLIGVLPQRDTEWERRRNQVRIEVTLMGGG